MGDALWNGVSLAFFDWSFELSAHRKNPPKDAAATIESLAAQGFAIIGIAKNLGIARETFKRWCEEDDALQEAFEMGRECERQALHALVVQSAVMNKPANVNAFFILKSKHGYRDYDPPSVNVDVAVQSVMVIKDHGDDNAWQEKVAAQQKALIGQEPTQLEASVPPTYSEPSHVVPMTPGVPIDAPAWRPKA